MNISKWFLKFVFIQTLHRQLIGSWFTFRFFFLVQRLFSKNIFLCFEIILVINSSAKSLMNEWFECGEKKIIKVFYSTLIFVVKKKLGFSQHNTAVVKFLFAHFHVWGLKKKTLISPYKKYCVCSFKKDCCLSKFCFPYQLNENIVLKLQVW